MNLDKERYESYEMLNLCSGAAHPSPNWELHVLKSSQLFIQFCTKISQISVCSKNNDKLSLVPPIPSIYDGTNDIDSPPPPPRGRGGGGQWPLPLSLPPRGVGANGPKFAPNCTWHPWVSNPVICNQRQINVLLHVWYVCLPSLVICHLCA